MDPTNNQTTNQPPVITQTPASTPTVPPMSPHHATNKLLFILLGLLFAVFVFLLVVYVSNVSLFKQPASPPAQTVITPPTPTMTDEEEVEAVDVGSVEAELEDIKTDLEEL